MRKKSLLVFILAIILIVSLLLVACQPSNQPEDPSNGENPSEQPNNPGGDDNPSEQPPADDPSQGGNPTEQPSEDESLAAKYEHISIAEAIKLANAAGETETEDEVTIVGTIVTVSNATYGEMTVSDETGSLYIFGSWSTDGTYYDSMTEKPVKGDEVVLKGVLKTYKGTPQMGTINKKATIVDWKTIEVEIDESDYKSCSIADARNAQKGDKVKVDGIVSAITYANGHKPSGVILIDESASIYVYSGDIAQQVSVGNKIEVAATKTYWILEDEQSSAAVHGYQGACQLESATLVSNDKQSNSFDKSWIKDITVKELLNTEVTENITSLVYKSTAYIKRDQGTGFVNYYINDIDGTTGTYVYTQCNGSDFDWIDKYDGKICEVYYTALNAKSTAAGCNYRLLPIEINVISDFSFSAENVPAFAIEYGVIDLFEKTTYGADPALKLPVSYSNELIDAENVAFTYSVDDTSVGSINVADDICTLNLIKNGSVEVTITATFGSHSASKKVTLTLEKSEEVTTPTVAEIIETKDGETVQVRGIVVSSLVNQTGFYLSDSTGIIAVRTTDDVVSQLKPGNEIVVSGVKKHVKKDAAAETYVGQCAIDNAVLVANYYGEHDYATDYFIKDKTIKDLTELDAKIDYTTNVYVVKAKIVVIEAQFYSQIKIEGEDGTQMNLYSSSANQYSWLKEYKDQTVTLELAVCNWNGKNYYVGCAISAIVDGQKIINSLNFES